MTITNTTAERLELIAIGPGNDDFWRRIIPSGRVIRLGLRTQERLERPLGSMDLREQADIVMQGEQVQITCLETATNKISWQGELRVKCTLEHGDEFNIGQTRFVIGPSAESLHAKATAIAEAQPSIDEIVQQPPRQRLERVLDMLSDDVRPLPPNPQAVAVPQSPVDPNPPVEPNPQPQKGAERETQPKQEAKPNPQEPPAKQQTGEAASLRSELERQQEREREIAEEAQRLAQQKNERSMEARFLREEVAQLRSKLRKRSQTAKQPDEIIRAAQHAIADDEPAETNEGHHSSGNQSANIAALQAEIQHLQEILSKQLVAIENSDHRIGANTQLEMTRASLEAERQARAHSQREADTLREEIAALQAHMQDVRTGKSKQDAEEGIDAHALETHLGMTAVEVEDSDETEGGQAGAAIFRGYELLNQIYNGGTGQVLKAKHQRMNRMVAIKLLSEQHQSSIMVGRFARKVQILAYLNHPNLVSAYDAGQEGGVHYLITEYIPGRSLIRLLKRIRQLDIAHAIHFISQTCNALEYVHQRRIFHRNLNPSHLLVTPEKSIKIVGWGSALFEGDEKLKEYEAKGVLVGTPDYMAPEQIDDPGLVDQRADIYSLGCTLYSIMTKRVIFPVDWTRRKLIAQRHKPAPHIKELRPDAPNLLEHIFQKMVAKEPDDRFQTMAEVREALNAVVQLPKDDN